MCICGCIVFALIGARDDERAGRVLEFSGAEIERILQHVWETLPTDPTNRYADDPAAAHFGQYLFFETRLSSTGAMSCATCHQPEKAFTDGLPVARGTRELDRNTMTLLNAAANRWYFWDGRADTLWSQALHPIEDEREFASTRTTLARTIQNDAELRAAYESIFGSMPDLSDGARFPERARPVADDPQHPDHLAWLAMSAEDRAAIDRIFANVGKAIAAYERKLTSADSPFDQFARQLEAGQFKAAPALTPQAQRGLKLFIGEANCRLCHSGPNFSDGEFHNNGIPPRGGAKPTDPGRYRAIAVVRASEFRAAGPYSDDPESAAAKRLRFLAARSDFWGQFKTPTLRNISRTSPYMHAGQFETLRDVLDFYNTLERQVAVGHHQETVLQPLGLTEENLAELEAFVRSLDGRPLDDGLLRKPLSPRPTR